MTHRVSGWNEGLHARDSPLAVVEMVLSHCWGLACIDALSSKLFKNIEILLRLYFICAKTSKKSCELAVVHVTSDLKEVFEFPGSGVFPVRSQGGQ